LTDKTTTGTHKKGKKTKDFDQFEEYKEFKPKKEVKIRHIVDEDGK
jgi:hypothetical protein